MYTPTDSDPAEVNDTREAIYKWINKILKEAPQSFLQ
jgi:hypothetical protein